MCFGQSLFFLLESVSTDGFISLEGRIFVKILATSSRYADSVLSEGKISEQVSELQIKLETLLKNAKNGEVITSGIKTVIVGEPNVGKSTLLNRLTGQSTAIVTDVPGTTRDLLKTKVQLDGLCLDLVDTAGIRETDDKVEQEGVRRALSEVETAELVLNVVDAQDMKPNQDGLLRFACNHSVKEIVVYNKIDKVQKNNFLKPEKNTVLISAKTGAGIQALTEKIKAVFGVSGEQDNHFSARRRHVVALQEGLEHIQHAKRQIKQNQMADLIAEHLRAAQVALSKITGDVSSDDLLGEIFSSFCVGK